jgi:hypothetical protein
MNKLFVALLAGAITTAAHAQMPGQASAPAAR